MPFDQLLIDPADVAALERGVAVLGSGGGGDSRTAATLLRRRLSAGREVAVRPIADVPPDAWVVPVGVVGATAVFTEKLPGGHEFAAIVSAIERWTGTRADALVSIEIGGLNGMMPLVAACDLGLPTVDADLSGRGVPRLDQLTLAAADRPLAPAALAEPGGQVLVLGAGTPDDLERTARAFLSSAGGWAALALAPIPVRELAACSVPGSVSGALRLGRRVLDLGESPDPAKVADATSGRVLSLGRVVDVTRRPGPRHHGRAGFAQGSVTLAEHASGALLRLEMENEYLLALRDGLVVATTPDVLTVLDRRTAVPIACDTIRAGMEVMVLQLAIAPFWTVPGRIDVLAPRAYGIDCDPVLLGADR
ncbi:hypothetical protein SAMN05421874_101601 [Nonomuraea maritima]|uniref:DUF917 domain-containing protein n=1 Tax=Nonomuraea maritima TaxID=683260 RepID=A0A1G8T737_9ACTN|nr:DUF917 domain-containing protein [Nonomuraea maritima]SDJ37342.1 hypothetical protein SAMN05421874_101601 [Nonomuraea maritima]